MNRRLFFLLLAVLAVKAIFLALDREPSFYFSDSAVYLTTAIGKWIPPDHSFVYGLLLRPLTVWPRSLEPMVVMQAVLSGIAAWLTGLLLVRYFATGFRVAACCSIVCAVEPLQLMRERYVLSESVATFVFAVFVWAMLSYLKTSGLSTLALVQILGVFLVSLRLSFLPVVLAMSITVSLLSRGAASFWRSWRRFDFQWLKGVRFVLVPLLVSVLVSQSLLFGYRHLYGELIHQPPAYVYRDGYFLAANFAPLIKPIDFPITSERDEILKDLRFPLSDPNARRAQRWAWGGICNVMYRDSGKNDAEANRLARETAMHALKRDPAGLLKLAAVTYAGFFNYARLKQDLLLEQGQLINPQPREAQMFNEVFGVNTESRSFSSLTKKWEGHSAIWCAIILILPPVFFIFIGIRWRRVRASHLVCGLCGLIFLLEATLAVEFPPPRYLTALAWLEFLMLGCIIAAVAERPWSERRTRKTRLHKEIAR